MINGIYGKWHYWEGTNKKILLSNEDKKELLQFDDIDQMINHLYLIGYKEAARHFNQIKKGSK